VVLVSRIVLKAKVLKMKFRTSNGRVRNQVDAVFFVSQLYDMCGFITFYQGGHCYSGWVSWLEEVVSSVSLVNKAKNSFKVFIFNLQIQR